MAVWNLFSRRQADEVRAGQEDVYQFATIPSHLRVQVQQISSDALGVFGAYGSAYVPDTDNPFWRDIEKTFKREKGLSNLQDGDFAGERLLKFTTACSTLDWLDILELTCVIALVAATPRFEKDRQDWGVKVTAADAIEEINHRIRQAGVGYQVEGGQVVKISSQFIHADVIVPALTLLRAPRFQTANEEFRKAHREFREGDYRDCITDCGKSLESVLKVLAAERGWASVDNNSQLSALIKAASDNGLFAGYMGDQLNGLRMMVQGAGAVRNKDGAHGAGTVASKADEDLAAYQLHQTAAALIFIDSRARAKL